MVQNPDIKEKNRVSVNPVDTFLQHQEVDSWSVGATPMLLAYDHEEVSVPILEDSVLISYTVQDVLDVENSMGNKLRFQFAVPAPQSDKENLKQLELCLWGYDMLEAPPSQLSAATIYPVSRFKQWRRICEWYTNFSEDEIHANREYSKINISFHEKAERGRLRGVHINKSSEGYTNYLEDELQSFFLVELKVPQFLVSAASNSPAHCSLSRFKQWNETCQWYPNYSEDELQECSRMSFKFHQKAETGRLTAVKRKYNTWMFGNDVKAEPAEFLLNPIRLSACGSILRGESITDLKVLPKISPSNKSSPGVS